MKTKTLIAAAISSTFGLATAAFAGSGHEVVTPSSPNESHPAGAFGFAERGDGARAHALGRQRLVGEP